MKKRGFTLIELLAVIVILAIIALIATPIVMNLIENSKRGAAERTAENIEKAAELYYYENRLDELFPGITFTCNGEKCSSNDKVLQINGKVPEIGSIKIDKEGVITLNSIIINGYNCYKENKGYKCDKLTKETVSSTDGILTLDSKITELSNYRVYGNSVNSEILIENLPSEYQQVEYIESTGTQYIDTETYLKSEYDIEFKFSTSSFATSSNDGINIFTSTDASKDNNWHYSSNLGGTVGQNDLFGWKYSGESRTGITMVNELSINTPYVIKTSGNDWYIGENKFSDSGVNTMSSGKTSPITLKLFTNFSNGAVKPFSAGNLKIYYFKVVNGEEVVANLVPCYRKSDNVVGLYDLVEGKFYENKGTGEFLKGSDVTGEIKGIESVGNYNSTTSLYEIPVKVINKNLYKESSFTLSTGLTVEYNPETHIYTINGTSTNAANIWLSNKFMPDVKVGEDVTLTTEIVSGTIANNGKYVYYSMFNNTNKSFIRNQNSLLLKPGKISKSAKMISGDYMHYCIQVGGEGVTFNNVELRVQLEKGTKSTQYEPYKEENYTISLSEPLRCVDDACDYIDFNSGKVVRNVGVESNGTLVKLEKSTTQDIDLPNIKVNEGINNVYVKTTIIPSKVEVEYYK